MTSRTKARSPRADAGHPLPRRVLVVQNRQRTRRINTRLLRTLTCWVLHNQLKAADHELCFHLVGATEMAKLNWDFLQHEGSTDVITFDHSDLANLSTGSSAGVFCGEIYISIDDAVAQARRFRTSWPSELARYVIHGLLHLAGHDDSKSLARRRMKRAENRLLRAAARAFPLNDLDRSPTPRRKS